MQTNYQLTLISRKLILLTITFFSLFAITTFGQSEIIELHSFDHVIVSPNIEVIFKKGTKESVSIESISVPEEKFNVELKNDKLHLFLEGAKITSPTRKEFVNGYEMQNPIYQGPVVKVIVTYNDVHTFDLRGEEKFVFEDKLEAVDLRLKIYGEAEVYMNYVDIQNLNTSIYGENYFVVKEGSIESMKLKVYGESEVNTMEVESSETKLTVYGESQFFFNVSNKIKVTSYGESTIEYAGSASLNKGVIVGDTDISQVGI